MSGVFSMASHCVLQYLPDVVMHEQTGWAHFSAFAVVISILPAWDPKWRIQAQNSSHPKNLRLYRSAHIAIGGGILPIGIEASAGFADPSAAIYGRAVSGSAINSSKSVR